MPDTENPRSHIQPVPLPIPLQIPHLRSSNQEGSCDWENYERRRHQMSKCGYRSVIYKPYQPVGEVFLDDRKLILSGLRQEQTEQNNHAYLGEKPYPLGRHIHLCLIQGSTPPPRGGGGISCCLLLVHVISCTFYVASSTWMSSHPFFLRHLVYLSRRSISFSLLTMFLLSCINNQQWKADALLAVALCKRTVTNFQFLITLPDPL